MKQLVPDSLAGRVIALLFGGLILFHIGGLWIYQNGLVSLVASERDHRLVERFVAIHQTLSDLAAAERDSAAHMLSSAGLDVHWTQQSLLASPPGDALLAPLRSRLKASLPDTADHRLRVGFLDDAPAAAGAAGPASRHVLLVSAQLSDGSWINAAAPEIRSLAYSARSVLLSTSAMGLGIVLVALVLARSLTRPLKTLATAAQRLGLPGQTAPVRESGPREVRIAARAFNQMQARIQHLMDDHTRSLAAVSHDLKTPITRLRLRAEFVGDPEINQKIADDLDEMERMIDATLMFLRDEIGQERSKATDVAAMLQTICDDETDAGQAVTYDGPSHATLLCRGPALKRAMANVIGNAVKYGGEAAVSLRDQGNMLTITVDDRGPGIPFEAMERVFEPFERLDASRNLNAGGHGLGLTSARTIVRAHGGDIGLFNRPGGGLRVTMTLPRTKAMGEPQR